MAAFGGPPADHAASERILGKSDYQTAPYLTS